jgi:hypothetical protein
MHNRINKIIIGLIFILGLKSDLFGAELFELINIELAQNSKTFLEDMIKAGLLEKQNDGNEYHVKKIYYLGIEFEGRIKITKETVESISYSFWPSRGHLDSEIAKELHKKVANKLNEKYGVSGYETGMPNADSGPREWPVVIWLVENDVIYISIQDYGRHAVWNINRVLRSNLETEAIDGKLFWKNILKEVEKHSSEKTPSIQTTTAAEYKKQSTLPDGKLHPESFIKEKQVQLMNKRENENHLFMPLFWIIGAIVFSVVLLIGIFMFKRKKNTKDK